MRRICKSTHNVFATSRRSLDLGKICLVFVFVSPHQIQWASKGGFDRPNATQVTALRALRNKTVIAQFSPIFVHELYFRGSFACNCCRTPTLIVIGAVIVQ